jgi:hypothetical protein
VKKEERGKERGREGRLVKGGRGRGGGREGFVQLGLNEAGTDKSGSILVFKTHQTEFKHE